MSIKTRLGKLNFLLNRNPIIESIRDSAKYIPENFKSVITITADFELAWAWRYSKSSDKPYSLAIKKAKSERENVPKILEFCEKYKIPITWATVGHLFLEKCEKTNEIAHPQIKRLKHFENTYWKYSSNDWFEYDPCSDYINSPEWYCPDLIEMIQQSRVKHEIGCHTFSHIDCSDKFCAPDVFESEINECKKAAENYGISLKSFVHPGHTIGNLTKLAELGFTSFQSDPGNILGYPVKHKNGLWELKRTYEFVFRNDWSIEYHIRRYKKIIDRAIKSNTVCNLWFHPSVNSEAVEQIFPEVFEYINDRRNDIWITIVGDYTNFLNSNAK